MNFDENLTDTLVIWVKYAERNKERYFGHREVRDWAAWYRLGIVKNSICRNCLYRTICDLKLRSSLVQNGLWNE